MRRAGRAGIVLCGGRSSRMGRPKAWLPWFGPTLIEHVLSQLRPVVDELIVVRSAVLELPPLGRDVRVVTDREPDRGPLAGLREGLSAARADLAFVTSTDAPFVTPEHVARLLDLEAPVAPVAEGRTQVLSAVYPCSAWKEAADLLEQGIARPLALLERVGYAPLDLGERAGGAEDRRGGDPDIVRRSSPPAWRGFNTPTEYLDCARLVDPGAQAEVELLGRAALGVEERCLSVPIGTLSEVLARIPSRVRLVEGGRVATAHLVSLGGRALVRDGGLPVGPGERVSVLDSQAGG
ncbi:MAG TPA: molybdenum cofactor guanylyltransferase [Myxococcota bacterium]|nr:molybdenum cofactor guanylyltransferase [Myxococcota bacterium]